MMNDNMSMRPEQWWAEICAPCSREVVHILVSKIVHYSHSSCFSEQISIVVSIFLCLWAKASQQRSKHKCMQRMVGVDGLEERLPIKSSPWIQKRGITVSFQGPGILCRLQGSRGWGWGEWEWGGWGGALYSYGKEMHMLMKWREGLPAVSSFLGKGFYWGAVWNGQISIDFFFLTVIQFTNF